MAGWGESLRNSEWGGSTSAPGRPASARAAAQSEDTVAAAVWLGDVNALKRLLWPSTGGRPSEARQDKDKAYLLANSRGKSNETPLHVAVRGSVEIATVLLEAGAEPNLKDKSGWTPLHFAAMKGNYAMCELLVKWGGNKQVFTEDPDQRRPKSPWDLAPATDVELRKLLWYEGVEKNVINGPRSDGPQGGGGGSGAGALAAAVFVGGAALTLIGKVLSGGPQNPQPKQQRKGTAEQKAPPPPAKNRQ